MSEASFVHVAHVWRNAVSTPKNRTGSSNGRQRASHLRFGERSAVNMMRGAFERGLLSNVQAGNGHVHA